MWVVGSAFVVHTGEKPEALQVVDQNIASVVCPQSGLKKTINPFQNPLQSSPTLGPPCCEAWGGGRRTDRSSAFVPNWLAHSRPDIMGCANQAWQGVGDRSRRARPETMRCTGRGIRLTASGPAPPGAWLRLQLPVAQTHCVVPKAPDVQKPASPPSCPPWTLSDQDHGPLSLCPWLVGLEPSRPGDQQWCPS